MPPSACLIDDFGPLPVVRPTTVAELGDLVRQAATTDDALYPVGGRTQLHLGLPPSRPGLAVDLSALDTVVDYPARDMTITVQAGLTIARLQAILAAENQRLPIDVPHADRATLGGSIAANVSGPRRLGFGSFRDYVIGISVVNDEGHETKGGGRVVKNVAGYDLCKLYTGSLGTLGVITQVTLKLKPRPDEQALLAVGLADKDAAAFLDRVHASRTRPVCVELLNGAAARAAAPGRLPDTAWVGLVGFEDNQEAVRWQVRTFLDEAAGHGHGAVESFASEMAAPLWRALAELPGRSGESLTFKANLPPSEVAVFCILAEGRLPGVLLQAHAASGIAIGHAPGDLATLGPALQELLAFAGPRHGNAVVWRCPPAWKRSLPVWGLPRGDRDVMLSVKQKLDPRGRFNPGRFVV